MRIAMALPIRESIRCVSVVTKAFSRLGIEKKEWSIEAGMHGFSASCMESR
jgi:hypothetical protein